MSLLEPALSSPILALATTVHLAFAVLRNHRSTAPISMLAAVSLFLGALPWALPATNGVLLGLGLHAVWFGICERLTPVPVPPPKRPPPPTATGKSRPPARPAGPTPRPAVAAPAKPQGFVQVPVLAVIKESADIRTFRFARPEGFDFIPGQFLPVRVKADGKDHIRCYSLSSAPSMRGYLEISVKRQGLVSKILHATLRPGTSLFVKAPAGAFTYPVDDDRPIVLLAGGIGITPVLSMLRHAVSNEPTRQVTLLYSAQSEDGLAFKDELEVLQRRNPQVRVVLAVTRGQPGPNIYPGRIDQGLLRATKTEFENAVALMCGPQPMIDGLRKALSELGMPQPQIRSELFESAVASVTAPAPKAPAAATTDASAPAPAGDSATHELRCNGSTVQVEPGQTLLDAAEAGGFPIDSVCRAGVCGTCRTRVVEGSVDCDSEMINDAERQEGFVLACVSEVRSNCTIEAAT